MLTCNSKYLHAQCIGMVVQGMCRAEAEKVLWTSGLLRRFRFQYKEEAEEFYKHLKGRIEHFGMTLEEQNQQEEIYKEM